MKLVCTVVARYRTHPDDVLLEWPESGKTCEEIGFYTGAALVVWPRRRSFNRPHALCSPRAVYLMPRFASRLSTSALVAGSLWLVLLTLPMLVSAQKDKGKSGDAAKILRQADAYLQNENFTEAAKLYRQAIRLDPGNYYVMLRLAEVNADLDPEEAVNWYQSALDLEPTKVDTTWFRMGIQLQKLQRYQESTRSFERFLELHDRRDFLRDLAQRQIEANTWAQQELRRRPAFEVTRNGTLSSPNTDYDPIIFRKGNNRFVIVTSHRKGSTGKDNFGRYGAEPFSDLYQGRVTDDSTFGRLENMGKNINTKANDGTAAVTPDGEWLYYSIPNKGKAPKKTNPNYGMAIYRSKWNEDKKQWSRKELVKGIGGTVIATVDSRGKTKNVPTYDGQPTFTPDGNTMYFISDRPGGIGGSDIWYATRTGEGWSAPVNVGKPINTEFNEIQPTIGENGTTLYFASDGHKGLGGYDIYQSEGALGNWSEPVNLGHPLNTSYDEISIVWTIPDSVGLISSLRPESAKSDIFLVRSLNRPAEDLTITIQGRVRDVKTKQTIPFATVQLYEVLTGQLAALDTFRTDQTGQYKFTLQRDRDYKLVGNAPEYLANEVQVSTKNIFENTQLEADIDIFLERIEVSRPVVLQNIYYDFDKAELRAESITELDRIVQLMEENPGITIQLGAHTDTNGPERYNLSLSQRRAQSVIAYLRSKNIATSRIRSFGFGESQPLVYPEMSDEDEQTNRRSEFRILTLDLPAGATR